jgi:two-component system KDP operon response regulator KdpE
MSNLNPESGPIILFVEDDVQIRRFLRATLPTNGYRFIETTTGLDALRQIGLQHPDVVILDLGLPDIDGIEVLHRLREWSNVPVIVLSARDQDQDKIAALDAGADDYLTKPFSTGELLARIRVALRHLIQAASELEKPTFTVGGLTVDLLNRQVFRDNVEIHLTPIEYKLLTMLVRYAGKVVTQSQLLKEVWGVNYTNENHYLRIYMGHLRRKLEPDPTNPQYLITEPGVGYRLKID